MSHVTFVWLSRMERLNSITWPTMSLEWNPCKNAGPESSGDFLLGNSRRVVSMLHGGVGSGLPVGFRFLVPVAVIKL